MRESMHRFKYTKLTSNQIGQKLSAASAGPACASATEEILVGKSLKIVTDNGPTLSYSFRDKARLTLTEGTGKPVDAAYGALDLKQVVLVSHLVPGTQKGFNVVIDRETNLATVFEVWFAGGKDSGGQPLDDREVQRQIYYGYVEVPGQKTPEARHHLTNRLEGKGFHWVQDTGIETLEFYPSIISSSFVELTRHVDDLGYCSPSDFVKINDNIFIYDRTECEFSGIHTMYVMDLYSMQQIGMRLGFNEMDELEFYVFRGRGEDLGTLAFLEPFNDHGDKISLGPNRPMSTEKGARPVYRPLRTFANMTENEVHEAAQKNTRVFPDGGGMAGNSLPLSAYLVGKEFTVRYDDGPAWDYRVDDTKKLRWRNAGESRWHEEEYRAFEGDQDLIFLGHLHSGTKPAEAKQIVLDFNNGLSTCIHSKMGTEYMGNEVSYKASFGAIEMAGLEAPKYIRHSFTDELVGRAFSWSYSDAMTSMHVYTTPHSSSWTIYMENQALGMNWCAPCLYVKIRDGIYLFNLVEEACNGAETCVLINTKTMHDCGFGFSGGARGLSLGTIGALARNIGQYDVRRFFGPRPRKTGAAV